MAKLYFYYGTMNSGKSTHLLQSKYNYEERGMHTLAFSPAIDDRYGRKTITSRIGCSVDAIEFSNETVFYDHLCHENKISCIFIDEAHFLTKKQIKQLLPISVPILCYGLRTDFKGELFEGSQWLLAWADTIQEIKSICHCGKKSTMTARIDSLGSIIKEGDQIEIGGNEKYKSFCHKHFWKSDDI